MVTEVGLPLTINAVLHRGNLARMAAMVDEAIGLGARRIELAHTQYYGWAARNREALMPELTDAVAASATVADLRERTAGRITIDYVPPDHFARYPKPCMNGWGRQSLNVTPRGLVLPCHAAQTIPGLSFWNVRDRSLAERSGGIRRPSTRSAARTGCASRAGAASAARSTSAAAAARPWR